MANVFDLVERSNAICKKYERYLEEPKNSSKPARKNGTKFEDDMGELTEQVEALEEEAKTVAKTKDRLLVATKNAEIRKRKAELLSDATTLRKTSVKTQSPKAQAADRSQQVDALEDRICAIPDGMNAVRKKPVAPGRKGIFSSFSPKKGHEVQLEEGDADAMNQNPAYYESTEENRQFESEWQRRKRAQDQQLDVIERGLGNLQNIGTDMHAELRKQDPLVDQMETNMDKAAHAVNTNNQKLAGVLKKVRSGRNFCIDLILIAILLALAGYIYTLVR